MKTKRALERMYNQVVRLMRLSVVEEQFLVESLTQPLSRVTTKAGRMKRVPLDSFFGDKRQHSRLDLP